MGLLPDDLIEDLQAEALRAHTKHGKYSLLGDALRTDQRLSALVEEVGEAAKELTYDGARSPKGLESELIQVANVALSWVVQLRRVHAAFQDNSWTQYSGKEGA